MSVDVSGCVDGCLPELTVVGFRLGTFVSACVGFTEELMMMRTGFVIAM